MKNPSPPAASEPRHPIKLVARRTGLTPEVIRAWERRYGAILPSRSPTRRRLYSDEEVERLRLLRQVTLAGRRIGDVAGKSVDELRGLLREDRAASPVESRPRPIAEERVVECLDAMRDLDARRLESALTRASLELGAIDWIDRVLLPLLERIGQGWTDGSISIHQEHLATAIVHGMLERLSRSHVAPESAPHLIATTPAGSRHELGALMVAVTATALGWQVAYLGGDLPAGEIADAAAAFESAVVALSIVHPEADPGIQAELEQLGDRLRDETRLIVGGRAAASYAATLDRIGAARPDSAQALRDYLATLG